MNHLNLLILFFTFFLCRLFAQDSSIIVNDISQLNPVKINSIISPVSTFEIIEAVKNHKGPISIGGSKYSSGGQTSTENALQIDMRNFDSILNFSKTEKEITVQSGITWRKIQEFIDPYDLSIKIMQTYANFTVGGSLSVNVHGRYIGQGPIILSIKEIKIILANGNIITASPLENKELFYGAIGGYGGLGVITQVTLRLTDNCKLERTDKVFSIKGYRNYFFENIRNDSTIVFHNADIYPKKYNKVRANTYTKTSKKLTNKKRLKFIDKKYRFNKIAFKVISDFPIGKWIRQHLIDPIMYHGNPVVWRNYEASYDALELEPRSRKKSTYVIQEYFVPVEKFDTFYPILTEILRKNKVNVMNISIRHSNPDPGSLLAWAKTEVFAFAIYYKQGIKQEAKNETKKWAQQLIDAAILCNGSYYLPYQIFASQKQFLDAYPNAVKFFELKKQIDPTNKFRNKLWDTYY